MDAVCWIYSGDAWLIKALYMQIFMLVSVSVLIIMYCWS